ncbi:hypothetical protein DEU56DRAFT_755552 [Suillus clintonianus]|uniref:uncharacterized protein n=1 Tax=Suillus clintonianus TaxID=1904413 RepID=UPI001B86F860|nr:uncharacterized protein DEU56DRAFT_755552 [Suillus clintonianus]KAG2139231.1 hypothetical protein DEU56DRAFT_755552 [Suillus clintonianus]
MNPPELQDKQNLWSFNHRTRVHYTFDSSDSESEAETRCNTNLPSDDTRLIQELDISSRNETVEYKPNPWSIARINAASRPPNKAPPSQAISENTRQKSQPRAPQGRIVDAFKVQAERKPPREPLPLKTLKVPKPKSKTPRASQVDQVCSHIQGMSRAELGGYSQHNNVSFSARDSQTRPSDTPVILSSNAPQGDLHELRFQPHLGVLTLSCIPGKTSILLRDCFRVTNSLRILAVVNVLLVIVPAMEPYRTGSPAMVKAEPPSMPQWLASTIHSSLNSPQTQAEFVERASSPVRYHNAPESRKRPYQSPMSSPLPQRAQKCTPKRNVADSSISRGVHHISAYAFDDDPDANWSTVMKPEKKKSKKFKPGNDQSSRPFGLRLPGITFGNSKDRGTGVTQPEKRHDTRTKRRVTTYLPPPPPQRTVAPIENPQEHYAPDDDAFPPGFTPAAQPPQESGRVSPLLQTDSDDLTLVDEVGEQVITFDVGEVKERYPKVRKLIKEQTRVMLPELLGLPSCGIVWRDDGVVGADDTENREMKISVWPFVG